MCIQELHKSSIAAADRTSGKVPLSQTSRLVLSNSPVPTSACTLAVLPRPTHHPPYPTSKAFSAISFPLSTSIEIGLAIFSVFDIWWIDVETRYSCVCVEGTWLESILSDVYRSWRPDAHQRASLGLGCWCGHCGRGIAKKCIHVF
jgi:hypothetical protein